MRWISKVKLENFQSYKNEIISLQPGLNLILGSSDSGKSAALRAISFVLYNTPRNKTLIHNGEKEVKVSIQYNDGTIVSRIKGEANSVILKYPNGKKQIFEKIDNSLPEEVLEALGHPPKDEFNGLISYADQFSEMFLVDLSATDLPRALSSLTGIEILEESVKQLVRSNNVLEKELKSNRSNLDQFKNELSKFNQISKVELLINKTDINHKKILDLNDKFEKLSNINDLFVNNFSKKDLNNINSIIKKIEKTNESFSVYEKLIEKNNSLTIIKDYSSGKIDASHFELINSVEIKIGKLKSIIDNFEQCCAKAESLERIAGEYSRVKNIGSSLMKEYKQDKSEIEILENKIEEIQKILINENIICDKCGSEIK